MTPTSSPIDAEIVEATGCRRTMAVTVAEPVVRAQLDRALQQAAGRVKLPGFRKGKAPLAAVERHHGAAVRREALQRVIDEAYRMALDARSIRPITEGEVESVDYRPEGGLAFRISFEVRPEIELAQLEGFTVERPRPEVPVERVEAALASVREEHALWRPADDDGRPGDGDLVTVRILPLSAGGEPQLGGAQDVGLPWARRLRLRAGTEHRGRYQVVIGAGDALPPLEEAVRSLTPGETRDFALPLPDEGGEVAERRLRITLEDREIKELPELDDIFARSLGDFDDAAALRAQVESDLREEASDRAEAVLCARLLDRIVDANPFDAPPSMVERYAVSLDEPEGGGGAETVGRRADLLAEAERAVKRTLVLERVAELHGLAATEADLDLRVAEIASRGQVTPAQVRDQLVRTGRLERLAADITHAKVFDFLKRQSRIVEEEGP